jgi:tRNA A-37 threonylcarbamoyl transferase component Bud32
MGYAEDHIEFDKLYAIGVDAAQLARRAMDHEERAEKILAEFYRGYWSDPELVDLIVKEFEAVEAEERARCEEVLNLWRTR